MHYLVPLIICGTQRDGLLDGKANAGGPLPGKFRLIHPGEGMGEILSVLRRVIDGQGGVFLVI